MYESHNMKNYLTILLIGLLATADFQAQTAADIFRFSQRSYSGNARFMSLAGSQAALGGDFGSFSYNPAGLALFKHSEVNYSPGFTSTLGQTTFNDKSEFNTINDYFFAGGSLILARRPKDKPRKKGWWFTNVGIGINRLYNHNRSFSINAFNSSSSITDYFAQNANGQTEFDLIDNIYRDVTGTAYYLNLIETDGAIGNYSSVLSGGQIDQEQNVRHSGWKTEMLLDYGANFKDKYHFGFSIGYVRLNNTQEVFFSERDNFGTYDNFDFLELKETTLVYGLGWNVGLGAIVQVNEKIRVGASVKSPTKMSLSQYYEYDMEARASGPNGMQTQSISKPRDYSEYKYREPYRLNFGASIVLKDKATFSFGYEMVDYRTMKVDYDSSFFDELERELNEEIKSTYNASHILKFGLEAEFKGGWFARVGGSGTSSSYEDEDFGGLVASYGCGLGYRAKKFYIDVGYNFSQEVSNRPLYELNGQEVERVNENLNEKNLIFTIGRL